MAGVAQNFTTVNNRPQHVTNNFPRQQTIQLAVPEQEVWFGIPMQNPRKSRLVRKVMTLAMIAALIEVVQFTIEIFQETNQNRFFQSGINLFIALSVPYCGYVGARDDDRSKLCWFCGCSFTESCYTVLIIMWINQHIEYWSSVCQECEESVVDFDYDNAADMRHTGKYKSVQDCLFLTSSNSRITPEYCTDENFDKLRRIKTEVEVVHIPLAVLSFIMFYYGNKLYRSYEKVDVDLPLSGNHLPEMPDVIEAQTTFVEMTPQPPADSHGGARTLRENEIAAGATFAELPFAGEASMPENRYPLAYTSYATGAVLQDAPIINNNNYGGGGTYNSTTRNR